MERVNKRHAANLKAAQEAAKREYESQITPLTAERDSLKFQLEEFTKHQLIANVIRTSSQVYLTKDHTWGCPVVKAQIATKFENLTPHHASIKDINLTVCERGEDGNIHELPLKGEKPVVLRHKPKLRQYDNPAQEVEIAGLEIKGFGLSPAYFYIDGQMIVDIDEPTLINGKHFLRFSLTTTGGRKPYIVDIEVDWTEPGAWILSATPVTA